MSRDIFTFLKKKFEPTENLSETVRAIRKTKGWTQREMADEMGVDFQTVQRAENAGRNLRKQFLFFQKLLPFILAPELKDSSGHDVTRIIQNVALAEENEAAHALPPKKTSLSSLSARRSKVGQK